jgi:hypothetical protein
VGGVGAHIVLIRFHLADFQPASFTISANRLFEHLRDGRQYFFRMKRLGQCEVGAKLFGHGKILIGLHEIPSRNGDDGQVGIQVAEIQYGLNSFPHGHDEVGDDQVRLILPVDREGCRAVGCFQRGMARVAECLAQHAAEITVVVYQ